MAREQTFDLDVRGFFGYLKKKTEKADLWKTFHLRNGKILLMKRVISFSHLLKNVFVQHNSFSKEFFKRQEIP